VNLKTITYDARLLRGDPMLILSMVTPFVFWALMQFIFPVIERAVQEWWSYGIGPWYRHAGYFFMAMIPMMSGMVYGFILLDERDGGIITAISVTPTGKTGYLKLRLGIPIVLSFIFIVCYQLLLGLAGTMNFMQMLVLSILSASQSLMLLLFLGAFAANKVVGMAFTKGFGILLMGPLIDFILPGPYNWVGAFSPLFWTGRAFLATSDRTFWIYFGIALVFHGLLIWLLLRMFLRRSD
jgi:fluoroquinolone transport system permease protein